jgi:hypothetical protein
MDGQCCSVAPNENFHQQHQQQKCRVADHSSPLDKDDILDAVFSYVGIHDYVYTGVVSKRWNERYGTFCLSAPEAHRRSIAQTRVHTVRRCLALSKVHGRCTALTNAVTTTARLQLAVQNRLDLINLPVRTILEAVVMHSLDPRSIIPVAMVDYNGWESDLWESTVRNNKLQMLQWLHDRGFDFKGLITSAASTAVRNDYVALLTWLCSYADASLWTDKFKQELFWEAGRYSSIGSLEWLRSKGTGRTAPATSTTTLCFVMPSTDC